MAISPLYLGSAANDGTGDSARAAGAKINNNFRELSQRTGLPPAIPLILFDGDSKAPEAQASMSWCAARLGLDIDWSGSTGNSGGTGVGGSNSSNTGNNLTNATRMAANVAAIAGYVSAGRIVDYSMRMFTNDGFTPEASFANLRKFHNEVVRAAGCRYFIIWSPVPTSSTSGAANARWAALGRLLKQYATENSYDTVYLDSAQYLLDPSASNANGLPLPYTFTGTGSTAAGSVMRDNLHSSSKGYFMGHFAAMDFMRKAYPRKPQPYLALNGGYSSPDNLRGNMGGASRRTVALGGNVGSFVNSGTGTVTGTPPAGCYMDGVLTGTASIVYEASSITITEDDGPIPKGTWPTVKVTFSGATDASRTDCGAWLSFGQFSNGLTPSLTSGDKVMVGALLYLEALAGLMGISIFASNWLVSSPTLGAQNATAGTGSPAAQVLNLPITGPIQFEREVVVTSSLTSAQIGCGIYFPPSTTIGGSVHVLLAGYAHLVTPLPSAA